MSNFNQIIDSYKNMEDKDFPYSLPCMRCQSIIDSTFIRFHSDTISLPIKIFNNEDSEYKFGILDIKIRSEIPITSKHIHIFFTIDASGSMSDICSDRRTKMDYIHHTLENMLRIFHENNECNISIHVQSFNTTINSVITDIPDIRESDIEELIRLLRQIRPGGSTNIEAALEKATSKISNYYEVNPEHEIVHIFLTDGDITEGSSDYDLLIELVPKNCNNIFIGYGIDHDSQLLSHLSSNKSNEYRFIDALEKAGLVYGEVIHGLLYKAIEDVTLTAISGELYDYQTNTWVTLLQIGNLLSEQSKTFHVRSKHTEDFHVSMFGKTIVKTRQFQTINIYEQQGNTRPIFYQKSSNDLSIYVFRQKTQELLYKARQISEQNKKKFLKFNHMTLFEEKYREDNIFGEINEQNKNIKEELRNFHKVLIKYMKKKQLDNNPILKMLCDDIYIAYKTTGTPLGIMYTSARQTSNGRQQTYMCSATHTQCLYESGNPIRFPIKTQLQRQTNNPADSFLTQQDVFTLEGELVPHLMDIDDDIDSYAPTLDFLSPFSSDGVITLMREVSGNYTIGHQNATNNLTNLLDEEKESIQIN